jgi:DNA-binding HxlR family transcriptional regulator
MAKRPAGYGPSYPARKLLDLVGDKWTPVVLYSLSDSTKRYSEIQRDIPDITKKMLTQVLRTLERGGVLERKAYTVVPPRTEYRLTALGRRLHEPVAALCDWARSNEALLDEIHREMHVAFETGRE